MFALSFVGLIFVSIDCICFKYRNWFKV